MLGRKQRLFRRITRGARHLLSAAAGREVRLRPCSAWHVETLEGRRLLTSAAISTLTGDTPSGGTYQQLSSVTILTGQALTVDAQAVLPVDDQHMLGNDDPLATRFQWNFGDPAGKYNVLPGFNAAHVYDIAGNYTVTLTAKAGGTTATQTLHVTVNPNAQSLVYISGNGTAPWPTPTQNLTSPTNPTSLAAISGIANPFLSNTQYLFNRGDRLVLPKPMTLHDSGNNGLSNVTFGAYGNANAQPIIDGSQLGTLAFFDAGVNLPTPIANIMIQDVNIDSFSTSTTRPTVITWNGWNLTFRRDTIGYVGDVVDAGNQARNAGVLMQDDSTSATNSIYSSFVYMSGTDYTILGNRLTGSQHENIVRGDGNYSRILAYGNEIWNGAGDVPKTVINFRAGKYGYAASNSFHTNLNGTDLSFGLSPTTSGPFQFGVVEDNYFDNNVDVKITSGCSDIVARNNVFNMSSKQAFLLGDSNPGSFQGRDINLNILNNTAYSTSPVNGSAFITLVFPMAPTVSNPTVSSPTDHVVNLMGNLYAWPTADTNNSNFQGVDVLVKTPDATSFATVLNNLWQRGYQGTDATINNVNQTLAGWKSATTYSGNTTNDREQGSGSSLAQVTFDTQGFNTSTTRFTPIAQSASQVSELNGIPSLPADLSDDFYGNTRGTNTTVGAVQLPPPPPPSANSSHTATIVTLTWNAAPAANPITSNIRGYNVYRSKTGASGTWGSPINGSTPLTGTSTTDTPPGTNTWYYAVTTVDWAYLPGGGLDAGGNESLPTIVRVNLPSIIGVVNFNISQWYFDANGNHSWDQPVGGDLQLAPFGGPGATEVTGDWTGSGSKKIGTFAGGGWALDMNGNGGWDPSGGDIAPGFGGSADLAVVGDWNGIGKDQIGVFNPTSRVFSLDLNGDWSWAAPPDAGYVFSPPVPNTDTLKPISGKWNGGNQSEIGLWDQTTGVFYLDTNGDRQWDSGDTAFQFGSYIGAGYQPIAGDWNADGTTDIGLYNASVGTFYLDLNGDHVANDIPIGSWGSTGNQAAVI